MVLGVMTFYGAAPASADNLVEWFGDGCLNQLHRNDIGGLYANAGTCNGADNFWGGRVRDDHATSDGFCVRAVLDGVLMAASCDAAGTAFLFNDPQGNSNATTCITETNGSSRCASNVSF
jgi:hypothetical protein